MQTSRVSSCSENFVSIRLSFELQSLQESVRLQTPSHLTAPTCSGSMRGDTLLLLLFASTKFCDFGSGMILRVLIFAIS